MKITFGWGDNLYGCAGGGLDEGRYRARVRDVDGVTAGNFGRFRAGALAHEAPRGYGSSFASITLVVDHLLEQRRTAWAYG